MSAKTMENTHLNKYRIGAFIAIFFFALFSFMFSPAFSGTAFGSEKAGELNIPPVKTDIGAAHTESVSGGGSQSEIDNTIKEKQSYTPAAPSPSDPTSQSHFKGGGSGQWNCRAGAKPSGQGEVTTYIGCKSIVTSTITWGHPPPQWVGPHMDNARKYCGDGNKDQAGAINIGAHITYAIGREGRWTWPEWYDYPYFSHRIVSNNLVSVDCINLGYKDRQEICMASGLAVANKVIPNSKVVGSRSASTSWGRGNTSYESCENSQSVSINLGVSLTEMGRYTLDASVYGNAVTVRQYARNPVTGIKAPPEIIKIGPTFPAGSNRNYAQVTCKPEYSGASAVKSAVWRGTGWTWTASDCLDGDENTTPGQGNYQCVANDGAALDTPKVNGVHTRQADVFRDGERNTISWANPRPEGKYIVSSTPKRTKVERSGTPWNSPRSFPVNNNNFKLETNGANRLSSAKGTSWLSGGVFNFDASANWASNANDPTRLATTWEYDVKMTLPSVRVESLYINTTGEDVRVHINWSQTTVNLDSTARCYGYSNLNFVRAVND